MTPLFIFIAILIVIWALSGLATWVNKQQEQDRRRKFRDMMEHSGQGQRSVSPPVYQQPDYQPPLPTYQPPPQMAFQAPPPMPPPMSVSFRTPPPMPRRPRQQLRATKPPPRRHPARAAAPPPLNVLMLEEDEPVRRAPIASPVPRTTAAAPAPPVRSADAAALSRWLQPSTLRAQFILTEVFQPPIAMREDHLAG